MYRKINVIVALLLLSASCITDTKVYIYENSVFRAILTEQCNKLVGMELINLQTGSTYSTSPELSVYDDGVPVEGGLVSDYNKLIDNNLYHENIEDLYSCDSIYDIHTDSINICFGQESKYLGEVKPPHRRFDLVIWKSKLPDFADGEYTLYAVKFGMKK